MKQTVVIGAGRRVRGAILPALWCLRDHYRVAAVVARSERPIAIGGGRPAQMTRASLAGIDWAAVDLIVVAVPMLAVGAIVEGLARESVDGAVLMLDTPVLPVAGLAAGRRFRAFRRVVVAEDTIALPPYLLARRVIDSGAIGAVRRVQMFHSGFKYHGVASIKMLADGAPIVRMVSRRFGGKRRIKDVVLSGGITAVMYEPRDYAIGTFLIQGERGAIADYDLAGAHRIGYQLAGPLYRGLVLDGEPVPPTERDRAYLDSVTADVEDASPMNTMKLRALIDLLIAATDDDRSPLTYPPERAVADDLAWRIADRFGVVAGVDLLERAIARVWAVGSAR